MAFARLRRLLPLLPLLVLLLCSGGWADDTHARSKPTFEERLQAQLFAYINGSDETTRDRLRTLVDAFLLNRDPHQQRQPGTHHDEEIVARAQRRDAAGPDVARAGGDAAAATAAFAHSLHGGDGAAAAVAHSPHGGFADSAAVGQLKKEILLRQHKPFRERLQGLLPGDANGDVTAAEVAAAEQEILRFVIPRRTVVDLLADYVPVAWRGGDANNNLDACPNCVLRLKQGNSITSVLHASSVDPASIDHATRADAKAADVLVNVACASSGALVALVALVACARARVALWGGWFMCAGDCGRSCSRSIAPSTCRRALPMNTRMDWRTNDAHPARRCRGQLRDNSTVQDADGAASADGWRVRRIAGEWRENRRWRW
jgi:hypothetical protein